ncbi:MAG: mRNA surveillance protein pelota [Candidatus Woesearchaeota archaeon]
MRIMKKDFRKGNVRLEIQNKDDLWYLSYVIESGDIVGARTERKIKIGDEGDRKAKVTRKKLWLEIICERVEFSKTSSSLRINGKIREGKEDIAAGDYHSLDIAEGSLVTINKKDGVFLRYQKEKIEEASKNAPTNTLVCSVDRGEATIARLKNYGYEIVAVMKGEVQKKDFDENIKKEFFRELAEKIKEMVSREKFSTIVIGTIPFWSEKVKHEINDLLKNADAKVIYTICSSSGENGIKEMMSKEEVKNALKEERFAVEASMVNSLLSEISKSGNVEYGINEVKTASSIGAVDKLLITDGLIMGKREEDTFQNIEEIMKATDNNNGKIIIVSSEHEGGKQLEGLGGIAAFTRFKV